MTEKDFKGFDIETTGLVSSDCELVSWCAGNISGIQSESVSEELVIQKLYLAMVPEMGLLTFMGGTKYGPGFDFPFMRTRCAILGVPWPFGGVPHIDIYPIIQKRFDTKVSYTPVLEDLTVEDLKLMIKSMGIVSKAKKKQEYIDAINGLLDPEHISDYIRGTCKSKVKDLNNLKEIYELLTGEDPGDMRGGDVPRLWKQWQETHDNTLLDDIKEYNRADCQKVEVLWEIIKDTCPNHDLMPEIL